MAHLQLPGGLLVSVDEADLEALNQHRWHSHPRAYRDGSVRGHYAKGRLNGRTTYMHRFIMGDPVGFVIDHIDGDGLNNTRANLRACSRSENARNHSRQRPASGYYGVYRKRNTYHTRIVLAAGPTNFHGFETATEAALKYDEMALQHFGDFATLNFPRSVREGGP